MEMEIESKNPILRKTKKEIPIQPYQDRPPSGGDFRLAENRKNIVVDVPLDWPLGKCEMMPYTPPPEDYYKVIEASLGVPISKLGVLANMEVERIYFDGLCGGAKGHVKKMIPLKNWVAYVVKCLWVAYNKGLLRGCRPPRTVQAKE